MEPDHTFEKHLERLKERQIRLDEMVQEINDSQPQTMLERGQVLLEINRRIGVMLLFTKRTMRILECTREEVEAIREMRFKDFTLKRLLEIEEKLNPAREGSRIS